MIDLSDLGSLIRTNRKLRALSQHDLARQSGVSRALIAALELGHLPELGVKKLQRILHALELDLRITTFNSQRPTLEDLQADESAGP